MNQSTSSVTNTTLRLKTREIEQILSLLQGGQKYHRNCLCIESCTVLCTGCPALCTDSCRKRRRRHRYTDGRRITPSARQMCLCRTRLLVSDFYMQPQILLAFCLKASLLRSTGTWICTVIHISIHLRLFHRDNALPTQPYLRPPTGCLACILHLTFPFKVLTSASPPKHSRCKW